MTMWNFGQQGRTLGRPAARARHVGLGPSLIQKNQPLRREFALVGLPEPALAGHVRAVLLGGE